MRQNYTVVVFDRKPVRCVLVGTLLHETPQELLLGNVHPLEGSRTWAQTGTLPFMLSGPDLDTTEIPQMRVQKALITQRYTAEAYIFWRNRSPPIRSSNLEPGWVREFPTAQSLPRMLCGDPVPRPGLPPVCRFVLDTSSLTVPPVIRGFSDCWFAGINGGVAGTTYQFDALALLPRGLSEALSWRPGTPGMVWSRVQIEHDDIILRLGENP